MPLGSFPEEILFRVFKEYVPGDTLLNVCLASRRFRRVATPALYGEICLRTHAQKDALATTLVDHPELRAFVRRLYLSLDCCHIFYRTTNESDMCTVPSMFLLDMVPNLKEAVFLNFRSRALLKVFSGPKVFIPAGLCNLTSLFLDWEEDTGEGFSAEDIAMCMALPSLRRLTLDTLSRDSWNEADTVARTVDMLRSRAGSSGLTELTIQALGASQSFSTLQNMLRIPRGLTTLSIQVAVPEDANEIYVDPDPAAHPSYIMDGLPTSKGTLECLRLINQGSHPWGCLTSLAEFTRLKILQCEVTTLMSSDGATGLPSIIPLPDSLEALEIAWNTLEPEYVAAFSKLLVTRCLPALRHVNLSLNHRPLFRSAGEGVKKAVEVLRNAYASVGVELTVGGNARAWTYT